MSQVCIKRAYKLARYISEKMHLLPGIEIKKAARNGIPTRGAAKLQKWRTFRRICIICSSIVQFSLGLVLSFSL